MVPMRDGVRLATNVFVPDEGDGPWPVVLSRTPYGKGQAEKRELGEAQYTKNGYVRVVQDCRGRFDSEGKYNAFVDDRDDGYDTVEWCAAQPWCNGKVGMIGGSALGITANQATIARPPHLACTLVFVAHGSAYRNATFPGGAFLQNMNEEWLKRQGVEPSSERRPLQRAYGPDDAARDMSNFYSEITIPTLNVGGWYDIFCQGNVDCFVGLNNEGGEGARGKQKLIMGAFGHGRLAGKLVYPQDSGRLPQGELATQWFDHWLKGEDNGIDREPAVRYFMMGDTFDPQAPGNEWRTADNWPPESTPTAYYFHEGRRLDAKPPESSEGADTYVYDPRDPVPTMGGNNLMMALGPMDQREVSSRGDVLVYETPPLEAAVEIAGRVTAELAVSTDAEDTDFTVKLVDVYPDGYEALVLDQALRLRYREGLDNPQRIEKGHTYPIKVDLWSTALVFNRGHKIAVHVSSSNSPRFEKHSNTWEPVASYDDAVKATNSVYRHQGAASRIVLPVTKVYSQDTAERAAGGE
jgi:predicted acyl esterase